MKTDRILHLLETAGVQITPQFRNRIQRIRLEGKSYLIIEEDDEILATSDPAVILGAALNVEGVLRIVCLGETPEAESALLDWLDEAGEICGDASPWHDDGAPIVCQLDPDHFQDDHYSHDLGLSWRTGQVAHDAREEATV